MDSSSCFTDETFHHRETSLAQGHLAKNSQSRDLSTGLPLGGDRDQNFVEAVRTEASFRKSSQY